MVPPIFTRDELSNVAPIAAPLLMGSLFNWGLYGVLAMQVYLYYLAFPRDRWPAKALVYGVFMLDTAQTMIVSADVFNVYARHYGDVAALSGMYNEWLAVPVFSSIVSCTVQLYYAYRIFRLAESYGWLLMGIISVLALLQSIAGIATGVQAAIIGTFVGLEARAHSVTIIWLAGSAACDVIIALVMAYLLTHKDTHYPETRALISRVVHLVVKTGVLTALAAILVLVLYVALPSRAYYACVGAILAKLYSNALLVLFNSRLRIQGGRNEAPLAVSTLPGGASTQDAPPRSAARTWSVRLPRVSPRPPSRAALALEADPSRSAVESAMSSFGGVHVHEQVWVHTDEVEMKDRVVVSAEKTVMFDSVSDR